MKRSKMLMIGTLTVLSFAAYSPAKASDPHNHGDDLYSGASDKWHDWNDDDKNNRSQAGKGTSGTPSAPALPVNNYVWFLTFAGAAIGYKVIIDKVKIKRTSNAQ